MLSIDKPKLQPFPFSEIEASLRASDSPIYRALADRVKEAHNQFNKNGKPPESIDLRLPNVPDQERLMVVIGLCQIAKSHGIDSLVLVGTRAAQEELAKLAGRTHYRTDVCNIDEASISLQDNHQLIVFDDSVFSAATKKRNVCLKSLRKTLSSWDGPLKVVAFILNAGSRSQAPFLAREYNPIPSPYYQIRLRQLALVMWGSRFYGEGTECPGGDLRKAFERGAQETGYGKAAVNQVLVQRLSEDLNLDAAKLVKALYGHLGDSDAASDFSKIFDHLMNRASIKSSSFHKNKSIRESLSQLDSPATVGGITHVILQIPPESKLVIPGLFPIFPSTEQLEAAIKPLELAARKIGKNGYATQKDMGEFFIQLRRFTPSDLPKSMGLLRSLAEISTDFRGFFNLATQDNLLAWERLALDIKVSHLATTLLKSHPGLLIKLDENRVVINPQRIAELVVYAARHGLSFDQVKDRIAAGEIHSL
jgi:hypothetical protein